MVEEEARRGARRRRDHETCGAQRYRPARPPPRLDFARRHKDALHLRLDLWVRDVATGQERQLTTDGAKDFGYATSNAGWTTSAAPRSHGRPTATRLQRSTRTNGTSATCISSRRRSTAESGVARVEVSASRRSRGRHDSHRVIIDVDSGKMTRLMMGPDFHRAMSEDNLDMGGNLWSPDGSKLGFVSTDRFPQVVHRQACRRHHRRRASA